MSKYASLSLIFMFLIALFLLNEPKRVCEIRICGFSGMIPQEVIDDFEKETGIKVNYISCLGFDEVEAKLTAGNQYDLVVIAAWPYCDRIIELGMLQRIDLSEISNYKYLDEELVHKLKKFENFGVPFIWGTMGGGYNAHKLKEAESSLGHSISMTKAECFIDSSVMNDLNKFGKIVFIDSPLENLLIFMLSKGMNTKLCTKKEIDFVFSELQKIRKYIWKFDADCSTLSSLQSGVVIVTQGMSDDITRLVRDDFIEQHLRNIKGNERKYHDGTGRKCTDGSDDIQNFEAISTKNFSWYRPKIAVSILLNAQLMWVDFISITKNCKNIPAVLKFINFLLRKEINRRIAYIVGGHRVVELDKTLKSVVKNSSHLIDIGSENMRYLRRIWNKFKASACA